MRASTVWLVGMMGAGKSAVGPILAKRLARRFVDLDAEIAQRAGIAIAEIFEREGEEGFRARERVAWEELAGEPLVVALGGGAIAERGVAERLRESGVVVYLRARPEILLARVGSAAGRPLLAGLSRAERLERLRELLGRREASYRSAQLTVDTDERSPVEAAEIAAQRIRELES